MTESKQKSIPCHDFRGVRNSNYEPARRLYHRTRCDATYGAALSRSFCGSGACYTHGLPTRQAHTTAVDLRATCPARWAAGGVG